MLCVAEGPTSQKRRTNHLLQETLLSIEGATRGTWKFFDGEQRNLCTAALSPEEMQVEERRGTLGKKKVWCGRQ